MQVVKLLQLIILDNTATSATCVHTQANAVVNVLWHTGWLVVDKSHFY